MVEVILTGKLHDLCIGEGDLGMCSWFTDGGDADVRLITNHNLKKKNVNKELCNNHLALSQCRTSSVKWRCDISLMVAGLVLGVQWQYGSLPGAHQCWFCERMCLVECVCVCVCSGLRFWSVACRCGRSLNVPSGYVHIYKSDYSMNSFIIIIIIMMFVSSVTLVQTALNLLHIISFFFTDANFRTAAMFVTVDLQRMSPAPFATMFVFCPSTNPSGCSS